MRRHDSRGEFDSPVSREQIDKSRALPAETKALILIVARTSMPCETEWMLEKDRHPEQGSTESDRSHATTVLELVGQLPPRRSRLAWWLTAFGVLAATSMVSCCVGWIGLAMVFGPAQTKVPGEVEAIAQRMASLKLPPQFQPTWGWSADNSLFWFQVARFDHSEKRGVLLIGELHVRPMANPQEQMQLRQLIGVSSHDLRLIVAKQSEVRKLTVRGAEAEFEIVTGEDRASTTKMRQVTGMFRGQEGTVLLILQAEVEQLTDDAIDALFVSLTKSGEAL